MTYSTASKLHFWRVGTNIKSSTILNVRSYDLNTDGEICDSTVWKLEFPFVFFCLARKVACTNSVRVSLGGGVVEDREKGRNRRRSPGACSKMTAGNRGTSLLHTLGDDMNVARTPRLARKIHLYIYIYMYVYV